MYNCRNNRPSDNPYAFRYPSYDGMSFTKSLYSIYNA